MCLKRAKLKCKKSLWSRTWISPLNIWLILMLALANYSRLCQFSPPCPLSSFFPCCSMLREPDWYIDKSFSSLVSSYFGQWQPWRELEREKGNEDGEYISFISSSKDCSWQCVLQLQFRSVIMILSTWCSCISRWLFIILFFSGLKNQS